MASNLRKFDSDQIIYFELIVELHLKVFEIFTFCRHSDTP